MGIKSMLTFHCTQFLTQCVSITSQLIPFRLQHKIGVWVIAISICGGAGVLGVERSSYPLDREVASAAPTETSVAFRAMLNALLWVLDDIIETHNCYLIASASGETNEDLAGALIWGYYSLGINPNLSQEDIGSSVQLCIDASIAVDTDSGELELSAETSASLKSVLAAMQAELFNAS